jgi:hypothetical protein
LSDKHHQIYFFSAVPLSNKKVIYVSRKFEEFYRVIEKNSGILKTVKHIEMIQVLKCGERT